MNGICDLEKSEKSIAKEVEKIAGLPIEERLEIFANLIVDHLIEIRNNHIVPSNQVEAFDGNG